MRHRRWSFKKMSIRQSRYILLIPNWSQKQGAGQGEIYMFYQDDNDRIRSATINRSGNRYGIELLRIYMGKV